MLLWKHPPTAAPQLWHTTGEAAPGRIDCTYHGCSRVTGPSEACNFDTQQACITRSSIQLNHAVYRCESRPHPRHPQPAHLDQPLLPHYTSPPRTPSTHLY